MQPAEIAVEKLPLESLDPDVDRFAKLQALYPDAFGEGKLDAEKLRQIFGEDLDVDPEHYGLVKAKPHSAHTIPIGKS
jgi:hypothetical protein